MKNTGNQIVDILTLRRDLYTVLSLLLADERVREMHQSDDVDWTTAFHENEVRRLMIWIAAAVRSLLDLPGKHGFGEQLCGVYWADARNENETQLGFRQACNSVIHAKEMIPYKVSSMKSGVDADQFYVDKITIRGMNKQKQLTTRAHLDIMLFVQIADTLMKSFEENDHVNQ